jgi:hypothetical protein
MPDIYQIPVKKNKVQNYKRVDYYVHLIKYSCRVPNQENS